MAFINRLSVDEVTGRAFVTTSAVSSTDPYLAGLRYADDGTLHVQDTAVGGTATFQDGYARDDNGVLYVRIDNPPTGSNAVYNDGILGDITGRMSMTTTNPIAGYSHGWPVDAVGSVCIIGTTPPPPTLQTFDTLIITNTSSELFAAIDNLRYGAGTNGSGFTTNQAGFLTDNPGLTLFTFEGIAPPGGVFQPYNGPGSGFSVTETAGGSGPAVSSASVVGAPSDFLLANVPGFPVSLTFTFSPKVSAVGLNLSAGPVTGTIRFRVLDGATSLTDQTISVAPWTSFTSFAGFTGLPVVGTSNRITGDSENRITADGDNRVWV